MNNAITIVGGGIVGLTMAALLAKNHFHATVIETKQPELEWNTLTARVSAIHHTAAHLFRYLDCHDLLAQSVPLHKMFIWDETQNTQLTFDSRDVNEMQMGYIIENRLIIKTLWEKIKNDSHITIHCPASPDQFHFDKNNLIIGADGAHSWVRNQMGVSLRERSYQQKSIIAVIQSEKPHDHTAIQKFLTTGPIALLPLTDSHHTALVWSSDDEISDHFMQLSSIEFSATLTRQLDYKLGQLQLLTDRSQFPLTMRHVDQYATEGFVLIGDAAHTIHPLAGLGVNLGLMDAACLIQVLLDARTNKKSITSLRTLRHYTRWRKADNTPIINAMRALQTAFSINTNSFNFIRSLSINTINHCLPIKNQLMKIAMGQSQDLPSFLQM